MPVNEKIDAIRGKLEPREIYPVTEDELKILEQGTGSSLYLNFAIAFLSFAVSTTISIYTGNTIPSDIPGAVYGFIYAGYSMGILCLILWQRTGNGHKKILAKIRARIEENKTKLEEEEKLELKRSPLKAERKIKLDH